MIMDVKVSLIKDLQEMVIAGEGDWKPSSDMIQGGLLSPTVLKLYYKKLGTISTQGKTYQVYKIEQSDYYIAGNLIIDQQSDDTKFEIDFTCKLKTDQEIPIDSKRMYEVFVNDNKRGLGISTSMYKFFIHKLNLTIVGDAIQFFGARKLWSRLSNDPTLEVDVYNLNTNEYIDHDIKLSHGDNNDDFDNSIYSDDLELEHIRLILSKL